MAMGTGTLQLAALFKHSCWRLLLDRFFFKPSIALWFTRFPEIYKLGVVVFDELFPENNLTTLGVFFLKKTKKTYKLLCKKKTHIQMHYKLLSTF